MARSTPAQTSLPLYLFHHDADVPGPSRCFPFWQELLACYVTNSSEDNPDGKNKCIPVMEDYYECLHHRKEVRQYRHTAPIIYDPQRLRPLT